MFVYFDTLDELVCKDRISTGIQLIHATESDDVNNCQILVQYLAAIHWKCEKAIMNQNIGHHFSSELVMCWCASAFPSFHWQTCIVMPKCNVLFLPLHHTVGSPLNACMALLHCTVFLRDSWLDDNNFLQKLKGELADYFVIMRYSLVMAIYYFLTTKYYFAITR